MGRVSHKRGHRVCRMGVYDDYAQRLDYCWQSGSLWDNGTGYSGEYALRLGCLNPTFSPRMIACCFDEATFLTLISLGISRCQVFASIKLAEPRISYK